MERKTQNDNKTASVSPYTVAEEKKKKLPVGAGRRGGKLRGYQTLLRGNIKDGFKAGSEPGYS